VSGVRVHHSREATNRTVNHRITAVCIADAKSAVSRTANRGRKGLPVTLNEIIEA
jgi:hypothetical protein